MKQKTFIIIAVVLVLAVVVFLNKDVIAASLKKDSDSKDGTTPGSTGGITGGTAPASTGLDFYKPLSKGSSGAEVTELQKRLNNKGGSQLPALIIDGIFGTKTEARLIEATGGTKKVTLMQAAMYMIV